MFPAKLFDPWWRSSNISFLVTINLSSSSSSSLSSFAPHCRFIFNIVIPATPPSQHAVFSVVSSFFPFSFPQSVTSFFSSSAHHKSVPSPSPHRRDRLLNSPTSTSILDKLLWNSPPLSPCENPCWSFFQTTVKGCLAGVMTMLWHMAQTPADNLHPEWSWNHCNLDLTFCS